MGNSGVLPNECRQPALAGYEYNRKAEQAAEGVHGRQLSVTDHTRSSGCRTPTNRQANGAFDELYVSPDDGVRAVGSDDVLGSGVQSRLHMLRVMRLLMQPDEQGKRTSHRLSA